jgi:hypothetical protein
MTDKAKFLGTRRVHPAENHDWHESYQGLTKREYFAGLAMQGLLSDGNNSPFSCGKIAELAVGCADALIEELSK